MPNAHLRLISPPDYDDLYGLLGGNSYLRQARFGGGTPSPEDFVRALWSGVIAQWGVHIDNQLSALVTVHSASHQDGTAQFVYVPLAKLDATSAHQDAVKAAFHELFGAMALRKVFTEFPSFYGSMLVDILGNSFQYEGRLIDFHYFNGRFCDRILASADARATTGVTRPAAIAPLALALAEAQSPASLCQQGRPDVHPSGMSNGASRTAQFAPQEGRFVRLEPVAASDYPYLRRLMLKGDAAQRWQFRGATPSPVQFEQALWHGVLSQFTIRRKDDGQPIGLATAYKARFDAGTVFMGLLLDSDSRARAWPLEAPRLMLDYLFRSYPFRKVYFETLAFNLPQYSSALGPNFAEEARLGEFAYLDGGYWDLVFMSLSRSSWEGRSRRRELTIARRRGSVEP